MSFFPENIGYVLALSAISFPDALSP